MSERQGKDAEMVGDPEGTICEALREYAGDGEGIDCEIFDRFIVKVRADALNEAASALRAMADDSPYSTVSRGQCADGWGNDMGDIDHGYADWIKERADRIEAGIE